MSSTLAKKVGYVKDRCINAYWMLRTGKFKLIFKSIFVEIRHRIADMRALFDKGRELDDSQVPGSGYLNKCKVVPPSNRPTESHIQASIPLKVDSKAVANQLRSILNSFVIKDGSNS